ncbi:homoserine O-succinyltransferase [Companilactobacillus alimentarius]|nr:homoserine O-succinyltransferase [Companilactobacillus alimentarius]MDT6953344.1 homoserine O-succinyltransferase [Companilactobacillus alimentarius]
MEPIKIGILNLMQNKLETMRNFQRVLAYENIELQFYYSATRYVNRTLDSAITDNMKPLDLEDIKTLDGFIITGSPVEKLDFPQVSYFDEVNSLIDQLNHSCMSVGAPWLPLIVFITFKKNCYRIRSLAFFKIKSLKTATF